MHCKNQYETHVGRLTYCVKNTGNSTLVPFRQDMLRRPHTRRALGLAKLDFGGGWPFLGNVLDVCWALLCASWPLFGASWVSWRHLLGVLGMVLNASWLPCTPPASILSAFGKVQATFWSPLGVVFGMLFARCRWVSLHHVLFAAGSPC